MTSVRLDDAVRSDPIESRLILDLRVAVLSSDAFAPKSESNDLADAEHDLEVGDEGCCCCCCCCCAVLLCW